MISDAQRDEVNLELDGALPTEREDVRALVQEYNCDVPTGARAEELPAHEDGTTLWYPMLWPEKYGPASAKLVQTPVVAGRPRLRLTGTLDNPNVIATTFGLNTQDQIMIRLTATQLPVNPGYRGDPAKFQTSKTASKQPIVDGAEGAARLPVRVHHEAIG